MSKQTLEEEEEKTIIVECT